MSGWVTATGPRIGERLVRLCAAVLTRVRFCVTVLAPARFCTTVLAPARQPAWLGLRQRAAGQRLASPALLQKAPDQLLPELLRRTPELLRPLPRPLQRPVWRRSGTGTGQPADRRRADRRRADRRRADRRRPDRPRPARAVLAAAAVGWAVCGLALFALFLHMSRTVPVNSDGAANALQAWAMLHGNLLLHTWRLSDVSFYTTELPQYMLIELARGLRPDVVHIAAAMTYALVVLLAARLAKGGATGTQGLLRAGIAAGIMAAPQHSEVTVLMLSPDHVGSTVPVLATWLLIDRARRRWYVPPAAAVLLGCALVADQIVLLTGIVPLIIVGLALAYQRVIRDGGGLRSGRYGLALAVAGAVAAEAGWRALALIRVHGGFYVFPVSDRIVGFGHLPGNLLQTYQGVLLLFGADFMGQRPGLALAIAFAHLAGLGLAAWGLCAAVRRLAGSDLAVRLLAAGTLISLAAYAFGPNAYDALSSREFAAVLPFGAVLAARVLAARLRRDRLVPALVAVLALYAVGAARVASVPPATGQNQAIADWLAAHKLNYGLSGYWMANSITLDSGGAVRMAPIKGAGSVWPLAWEDDPGWFNPARHVANFVVLPANGAVPGPGPGANPPTATSAIATFGQPARAYFLADYTVLVWTTNLLAAMPHH